MLIFVKIEHKRSLVFLNKTLRLPKNHVVQGRVDHRWRLSWDLGVVDCM